MNVLSIMPNQLRWNYLSCFGIKHIDTLHIGRLAVKGVRFGKTNLQDPFVGRAYLEDSGRMQDTMIVSCSDHGQGEKDLFYDCSARELRCRPTKPAHIIGST